MRVSDGMVQELGQRAIADARARNAAATSIASSGMRVQKPSDDPVAFAIGVPWDEAQKAGDLLGAKLFLTEFVAYLKLGAIPAGEFSERSRMIMTYALCGFANVGSVGIMVSGMTLLFPPEKRSEILDLAWKSLAPGFMTTLMTGAIVAAMPAAMFAGP